MPSIPDILTTVPAPPPFFPTQGGLQFRDVSSILATVVDNGVSTDDPRVLTRANEAVKTVLDYMIPVGGMAVANITAVSGLIILPPEMENAIEAYPALPETKVRGSSDIAQGWYEITNNSVYLDPAQQHDNPLEDLGLWPAPWAGYRDKLVRVYRYPGLQPDNAVVVVTGARRFIPMTQDGDYMIVQNHEALKCIILSIERYENNDPDGGKKYRDQGFEMLQAEVKKHIMDPRNYMRRKARYQDDIVNFAQDTAGWLRAQIALDVEEALRTGKQDLLWSINQMERRIMQMPGINLKDSIRTVTATVRGGCVYFPADVQAVLAVDLCGRPIPIRSEFFQYLDNGPGMSPACSSMLIDQGEERTPGLGGVRRKYKLVACCNEDQEISAVCKLRWVPKKAEDVMVIKNYEVMRLMVTSKFLEEKEDWKNAAVNQQQALKILDQELRDYLSGIRHTLHIQTYGFGLGDIQHGTL